VIASTTSPSRSTPSEPGEGASRDAFSGHAGETPHEWVFATRWWHELHDPGIGVEIMGAGKFGFPGWHEDPDWKGAWGPNPPVHTPMFLLTHHPRPSIEMEGDISRSTRSWEAPAPSMVTNRSPRRPRPQRHCQEVRRRWNTTQ
jgi:hypothetical protein